MLSVLQSLPKPKMSLPPCATLIAVIAQLSPIGTNGQFTWADGKQACCRVSGHEDWVFLKAVNTPSEEDFQAVEGIGVSFCHPEDIPTQQREVYQNPLVFFSLSVPSTHPPGCSNSLRECRKSRKAKFGVGAAPSMSYFSV